MFEYYAFNKTNKLNGIIGQVGDASGYKVHCFIECDPKYLAQFEEEREFIFVSGNTVKKGTFIFFLNVYILKATWSIWSFHRLELSKWWKIDRSTMVNSNQSFHKINSSDHIRHRSINRRKNIMSVRSRRHFIKYGAYLCHMPLADFISYIIAIYDHYLLYLFLLSGRWR